MNSLLSHDFHQFLVCKVHLFCLPTVYACVKKLDLIDSTIQYRWIRDVVGCFVVIVVVVVLSSSWVIPYRFDCRNKWPHVFKWVYVYVCLYYVCVLARIQNWHNKSFIFKQNKIKRISSNFFSSQSENLIFFFNFNSPFHISYKKEYRRSRMKKENWERKAIKYTILYS